MDGENFRFSLAALDVYENKDLHVVGEKIINYTINTQNTSGCPGLNVKSYVANVKENKAVSYFLFDDTQKYILDNSDKSSKGFPIIR